MCADFLIACAGIGDIQYHYLSLFLSLTLSSAIIIYVQLDYIINQ